MSIIETAVIEATNRLKSLEKDVFDKLWTFYDVGIVARNKPRTTSKILVYPRSRFPYMHGEMDVEESSDSVTNTDELGNEETIEVNSINSIEATWIPLGDRNVFAPDVRVGQRVFLYKWADSDELFWIDTGLDSRLQRLETFCLLFSADPDGVNDTDKSRENSYCLFISTHDKVIRFTTTALNGEPFEYELELDTANGIFKLEDSDGNIITLNSTETLIKFLNKEGTVIELNKKDIIAKAIEDMFIEAGRHFDLKVGGNLTAEVEGDWTEHIKGKYAGKVDGSYTLGTASYNLTSQGEWKIKGASGTIDIPMVKFTGAVEVAKTVSASSYASTSGSESSSFAGPVTFEKPVSAKGISSEGTVANTISGKSI